MRSRDGARARAGEGFLSSDPERHQLVSIGIEWGRTADELASVLTTEALWEILAVYDERAESMKKR